MNTGLKIKELREGAGMTQEELGALLGVQKSAINKYETGRVVNLKRSTIENLCRIFNVLPQDLIGGEIKAVRIPVLGHVHAGIPIDAIEDILDYEEISPQMAMTGEYFGLKVKGDCMAPRILEGDVVIVKKSPDAESGDTVVALLDGEAEIKKLIKYESGEAALVPANPLYEVRRGKFEIIGKVVELRGKL